MSALWRNDKSVKVWKIPRPCDVFRAKYDSIQENLQNISCMDDLLSGMFSISMFQCIVWHGLTTCMGIASSTTPYTRTRIFCEYYYSNMHASDIICNFHLMPTINSLNESYRYYFGKGLSPFMALY